MNRLKRLEAAGYQLDFLHATQPVGNVKVKESAIRIGAKWTATLYVYDLIKDPDYFWLLPFSHIGEGMVTIDIGTQNAEEIQQVLDKAVLKAQRETLQSTGIYRRQAQEEVDTLTQLAESILKRKDVMKYIKIRVHISADSQTELEKKIKTIRKQLEKDRFGTTVCLMEQKEEYQSRFLDYQTQKFLPNKRAGLDIASTEFGASLPLNYVYLYDKYGSYYGRTRTYGNFIFDRFELDGKYRTQYNMMVLGQMGFGKSTLLKKMMEDDAARGYLIYGFDKSGEYTHIANDWGGKVIRLDGAEGSINPFEIFPIVSDNFGTIDEQGCYTAHISKLSTWYCTIKPHTNTTEKNEFELLVSKLYQHYQFVNEDGDIIRERVTELPVTAYPTLSQFIDFIVAKTPINDIQATSWHNIVTQLKVLKTSYKRIFDGHTSIPNIANEQIVFFNIDGLVNLSKPIVSAQLYNATMVFYALLVKNGKEQKRLYETKAISFELQRRGSLYIDECHNVLNINNLELVNAMTTMMREARKLLISIVLSTQSMSEFIPEKTNNEQQEALRKVFAFCQYVTYFYLSTTELSRVKMATGNQLTDGQITRIGYFKQGECLFTFDGGASYEVKIEVTREEQRRYAGGGKTHEDGE